MSLIGQCEPAGVTQHVRMALERQSRLEASPLHHPGEPSRGEGTSRSLVKTNGDLGSCSRCKRRKARSSSPMIGWVLGVPCLTLRTCRVAVAKSIWSHRRSTSSDTRKPCRHATVHQAPTRHAEVQGTEWRPVASLNQVLGYRIQVHANRR